MRIYINCRRSRRWAKVRPARGTLPFSHLNCPALACAAGARRRAGF